MAVYMNVFCPGFIKVQCKPHPIDDEYHTTADCDTKIIIHIEIVKCKYDPSEDPYSSTDEEIKHGLKVASLVAKMTSCLHVSKRVIILGSGFGCVPSVVVFAIIIKVCENREGLRGN